MKKVLAIGAAALAVTFMAATTSCSKKSSGSSGAAAGAESESTAESKKAERKVPGNGAVYAKYKYDLNEAGDGIVIKGVIGEIGSFGSNENTLQLPDEIEGYPVVEVENIEVDAYNSHNIDYIYIPSSVKKITKLTIGSQKIRVNIDWESLESIGEEAFCGCCLIQVGDLTIKKNWPGTAFKGCDFGYSKVIFEDGIEKIPDDFFSSSYSYGGDYGPTFYTQCAGGFKLPAGLKEIGDGAFAFPNKYNYKMNYEDISNFTIPSTVTKIGKYAFAGSSIENVTISEGAKIEFGEGAFKNCSGLTIASKKALEAAGYTGEF